MSNQQLRSLSPSPIAPPEYSKNYEDNRNRLIDSNFLILFAINKLYGTSLNLSNLPTSSADLRVGDVWVDTGAGNVLKIVL